MMQTLYIFSGKHDKSLRKHEGQKVYSYCLGVGKIKGSDVINVNDNKKLNQIAASKARYFSNFVYDQNKLFIEQGLKLDDELSLYFLTDFSCKRSELFQTYSDYCNAYLIKQILLERGIGQVIFDECQPGFIEAASSLLKDIGTSVMNPIPGKYSIPKVIAKNLYFFFKVMTGNFLTYIFVRNEVKKNGSKKIANLFLTRYPSHLNAHALDDKYGALVGSDDRYLAHLFTDGFHQNLSVKEYLKSISRLKLLKNVFVLDHYLRTMDVLENMVLSIRLIPKMSRIAEKKYVLDGIDLSSNIRDEIYFSMMRLPRLLLWRKSINRFFGSHVVENFYFYLHEYSYGRFFTYMLSKYWSSINLIGFQHGPASLRKMVYMAGDGELSSKADGLTSFNVPNKVYAEDSFSANIYRSVGYDNVSVMPKIYRLSYLNKIKRHPVKNRILITPGLHDGEFLLRCLLDEMRQNSVILYILKTHPRADNRYVSSFCDVKNLVLADKPLLDLLAEVTKVLATYSSVAIEAKMLGIDVELIDIPGKINESPLIDDGFLDCVESIRTY